MQAYRETTAQSGRPALEVDGRDETWAAPGVPEHWAGFLYDWPFDPSRIETLILDHRPDPYPSHLSESDDILDTAQGGPGLFGHWDRVFGQLLALTSLTVKHLPPAEMESLIEALKGSASGSGLVCRGLATLEVTSTRITERTRCGLIEVIAVRSPGVGLGRAFKRIHLVECPFEGAGSFVEALNIEVHIGQ